MAGIRAWQLGSELAPLAVWDGRPGDGRGGTADTVAHWRGRGVDATVIDLSELLRRAAAGPGRPNPAAGRGRRLADKQTATRHGRHGAAGAAESDAAPRATLQAMLFADLADFSKLTEAEVLLFVKHFMTPVAALADRSAHRPIQRNSWGDGLYFVFANTTDAGMFALEMHEMMAATDWKASGFRWDLRLRTGLHVGPVYEWFNPLTGHKDYIGTHVSRAARLEPVTPMGQVYASEVFAAIAFAQGRGRVPLRVRRPAGDAQELRHLPHLPRPPGTAQRVRGRGGRGGAAGSLIEQILPAGYHFRLDTCAGTQPGKLTRSVLTGAWNIEILIPDNV